MRHTCKAVRQCVATKALRAEPGSSAAQALMTKASMRASGRRPTLRTYSRCRHMRPTMSSALRALADVGGMCCQDGRQMTPIVEGIVEETITALALSSQTLS